MNLLRHTRTFLAKLGGRKQCPACLKQIQPNEQTVVYKGRRHHRSCVTGHQVRL